MLCQNPGIAKKSWKSMGIVQLEQEFEEFVQHLYQHRTFEHPCFFWWTPAKDPVDSESSQICTNDG